jgi:hypothetical protein
MDQMANKRADGCLQWQFDVVGSGVVHDGFDVWLAMTTTARRRRIAG